MVEAFDKSNARLTPLFHSQILLMVSFFEVDVRSVFSTSLSLQDIIVHRLHSEL